MTLPPFVEEDPLDIALDPANVLPRRIARWATTDPHRPFLVEAATGRTASYGETWAEIGRWARVLADAGVGRGSRIATLLPSSVDAHVVWLAASVLGAYEVPVNPELRGEFLTHVLTDAAITVCVTRPQFASHVTSSGVEGITLVEAGADTPITTGVEPLPIDELPGPDDVSCVIYTSGTTGPSKGVVIAWAQMSAIVGRLPREWLSSDDAVYSPWPMFHVTGRSPMMAMADVGGRVVLREGFSRPDFWHDIRTHGCTSTTIGAVTGLLLAAPERDDDREHPLRFVLFGKVGDDGRRLLDRFGVEGVAFYGSTEVGFPVGQRPVAPGDEHLAGWLRRGYDGRVVDDTGADVDTGAIGELWIRPPDRRLILQEYLGRPELTAASVVDGWYRTGDAVRRHPNGAFEFVDRMRDTIRRFGENISSAALETAVLREPDVLECAAIGVPSPVTGHDVLVAVVAHDDAQIDPADLAARLRDRLPRYMRPSYVVVVDAFAHTPNGKIRKVGLLDTIDITAGSAHTLWKEPR